MGCQLFCDDTELTALGDEALRLIRARMQMIFVATEFVQKKLREFGDEPQLTLLWPYIESKKRIISEKRLQIPRDIQAVQEGARVRATDGLIGHVSEFIVDHKTGHITDLVLREGLPWDKKQAILPVVDIKRIEGNTVYLRLNKQAVKKRASKFKGRY